MMSTIKRRWMRTAASGVAISLVSATGALAAVSLYSGTTSQQRKVVLDVRDGRVGLMIAFSARCAGPAGPAKSISGTFTFSFKSNVRPDGHGNFTFHHRQNHATPKGSPGQYANIQSSVNGHVGASAASGSFHSVLTYHKTQGTLLGTCNTGAVHFRATH